MPFCPNCGTKFDHGKFCLECGQPLPQAQTSAPTQAPVQEAKPVVNEPVTSEPVKTEPVKVEPVAEPAKAEPIKVEPVAEPAKAEAPTKAVPQEIKAANTAAAEEATVKQTPFISRLFLLISTALAFVAGMVTLLLPVMNLVAKYTLDKGKTWKFLPVIKNGEKAIYTKGGGNLLSRLANGDTIEVVAAVLVMVGIVAGAVALAFAIIGFVKKKKSLMSSLISPILAMVGSVLTLVGMILEFFMASGARMSAVTGLPSKITDQYGKYIYWFTYEAEVLPLVIAIVLCVAVVALAIVGIIFSKKAVASGDTSSANDADKIAKAEAKAKAAEEKAQAKAEKQAAKANKQAKK
ncbi:MAG: hypothetical protein IJZ93_00345 [Clostridia bacterium]|nr:hypothetical protein [Clostridia bacterium]